MSEKTPQIPASWDRESITSPEAIKRVEKELGDFETSDLIPMEEVEKKKREERRKILTGAVEKFTLESEKEAEARLGSSEQSEEEADAAFARNLYMNKIGLSKEIDEDLRAEADEKVEASISREKKEEAAAKARLLEKKLGIASRVVDGEDSEKQRLEATIREAGGVEAYRAKKLAEFSEENEKLKAGIKTERDVGNRFEILNNRNQKVEVSPTEGKKQFNIMIRDIFDLKDGEGVSEGHKSEWSRILKCDVDLFMGGKPSDDGEFDGFTRSVIESLAGWLQSLERSNPRVDTKGLTVRSFLEQTLNIG